MQQRTILIGAAALSVTAAVLVACAPRPTAQAGQPLYDDYCAACHGDRGSGGDHPDAPDLDRLAAGNDGIFPTGPVLARVQGYGRDGAPAAASEMPSYAFLMRGDAVRVPLDDGTTARVPVRVAAITTYLRSVQR